MPLTYVAIKSARRCGVALAVALAAWLAPCGGMLPVATSSAADATSERTATSASEAVAGPDTAPSESVSPAPASTPVTVPSAATASDDFRKRELDALMEAVNALRQAVAGNHARSEELSAENERLRALIVSLRRDLAKSRDEREALEGQTQALEEQLRQIAGALPETGSERAAGEPAQVAPPAKATAEQRSVATAQSERRAEEAAGSYHVVAPGENLSRIGLAYGIDYLKLAKANGIANPDHIEVGQRIFIPGVPK